MKQNGSWTACFHYANVVHRKNALVLYYHLGQCVCPYVHHMDPKEYRKIVDQVKHFFHGGHVEIQKELKEKMGEAIESLLNLNVLRNCAIKSKPSIPL